jgi:hypothetical protein
MSRRASTALLLSAALFLFGALVPATAQTPVVVPLSENVGITERGSNSARKYGLGGDSLVGNHGELRGWRDVQLGHYHPAVPSQVNGDIGAGSAAHPGVLNIGADVSKAVRIQASGVTVLRFYRGRIKACDARGCLDLMRTLRRR